MSGDKGKKHDTRRIGLTLDKTKSMSQRAPNAYYTRGSRYQEHGQQPNDFKSQGAVGKGVANGALGALGLGPRIHGVWSHAQYTRRRVA
jgi:hypothetical protein